MIERFNREHPLIFDVIAMALTLLLAGVCSGVVMLLDRIAR